MLKKQGEFATNASLVVTQLLSDMYDMQNSANAANL